jgi:hypothetical protein
MFVGFKLHVSFFHHEQVLVVINQLCYLGVPHWADKTEDISCEYQIGRICLLQQMGNEYELLLYIYIISYIYIIPYIYIIYMIWYIYKIYIYCIYIHSTNQKWINMIEFWASTMGWYISYIYKYHILYIYPIYIYPIYI